MQSFDWQIFGVTLYGNTVGSWLAAPIVTAVVLIVLRFVRDRVASKLADLAKRTENQLDDIVSEMISRTKLLVLLVVAIWAGAQVLSLPGKAAGIVNGAAVVVLLLQVALWGNRLVRYVVERYVRLEAEDEATQAASAAALTFAGKLLLWSLVVLLALQNLGFEITPLLASLGIGGIAVALAAQNILGDLFASLSIMLDRPFIVGDFIIVGDLLGTVEYVGLKTTRIRSLHGEQLVFSNADLLGSRIRNFKRMQERRIVFGIGVLYETPYEKLARIPEMLREIIEKDERARFERAHFKEFGDSSLNFEIVYWVKLPDYNVYMDVQQVFNLEIFRRFQAEGIGFAYPTRTLYLGEPLVVTRADSSLDR